MRVNVTYSVELEEVKQIVKEILHKVEDSAKNINILFPQIVENSASDNEKKAVLVNPDLSYYFIDFDKMSVTMPTGKKTIRFKNWEQQYQQIFTDKDPALLN